MFDAVRAAEGAVMDRRAYHADAAALRADPAMTGDVWKLERSQVFSESGDPAWEAFCSGDWDRVLEIFESEREDIRAERQSYERLGLRLRRLRIVALPPTAYLVWEAHSHRIFVECGFEIRVLDAGLIRHFESGYPLPELMVYGGQVLYHIRYDENGVPAGAKRVDDPALARAAARSVSELYEQAEPFVGFFEREIASKAPARGSVGGFPAV
ncbi:DUF6879 family protein [Streptomonospora wellingtoniae]|uniref:DUF6879 domain-containing protein n=1 Tax=Streptomonospora wellingtoniae TaxID=3075544 RepID=A0ABU2KN50_9ACTN|nr:DUF6879 family protein [Streptomonospora sp. DSM 45055]MDT0300628.1 hypothetical protein [Streptomonospora sp. DSM 45055]